MFVVRDVDATIIIPNKFLPTRCLNEFYEFRIWIVKRIYVRLDCQTDVSYL